MLRGAWLLVIGCAAGLGACSGGYPLPPTRCDDFCEATHGMQCEDNYQPASCVSICEQQNIAVEACDEPFQALLKCFRTTPGVLQQLCVYDGRPSPCQPQRDTLGICVSATYLGGFGG